MNPDPEERSMLGAAEILKALEQMSDRPLFYKLDGHTPVPCYDANFSAFRQRHQLMLELGFDPWRVAWDEVGESIAVSTVFLHIDHGFFGEPVLFETMMTFNLKSSDRDWVMGGRYSTWDEAVQGHNLWLDKIKAGWRP